MGAKSPSCVQFYRLHGPKSSRLLCPWDSPGKNTGVGYHALLQGIFLTQGSNPYLLYLLHWQEVLYHYCHLGSPHHSVGRFIIGHKLYRQGIPPKVSPDNWSALVQRSSSGYAGGGTLHKVKRRARDVWSEITGRVEDA